MVALYVNIHYILYLYSIFKLQGCIMFKRLKIKIKTVAPFNHQSLQAKHGIKSLSAILTKHLTEQGQMWPKFLPLATFAYNMFISPNLANYSMYKLIFGRKPKTLLDFKTDPDIKNIRNIYRILQTSRKKNEVFAGHITAI